MVHQKCSYLKLKGQTYYFSRRVPKRIQKHFKTDRVEVCLHTTLESSARRQSQVLADELEDHWYILRRREMKDRLSNVFGGFEFGQGAALAQMGKGPKLSQALETYLSLKGTGRPQTFEGGARRSVGYLMEVTDDKPIDAYQRADANAFREYLRSRSLSSESIARTISNVRAIINFVSKEEGLQPSQAFSGVYLGEPTKKVTRYVPDAKELKKLQRLCRSSDDEMRWLLALISDTGLRLSEALGLSKSDVFLDTSTPYIVIEPKPWRRLKTTDSERVVPLVGEALWSAQRATAASHNDYLFPNYCDGNQVKSNSASGALNKWLKANVSKEIVVHSLRHAMRDRLRAVECPANIIDQIGGWSRKGVGESYGNGYQVEQLHRWMSSV